MRNRYSNANRDPRIITAQFDSVCAETGEKIVKGSECVYYPTTRKVYSMESTQAFDFKCWKADINNGHDY